MTQAREEIPLTEAAHLIGWDYQRLRSSVLRRECDGRQVYGRWVVDRESVLRLRDTHSRAAADAR